MFFIYHTFCGVSSHPPDQTAASSECERLHPCGRADRAAGRGAGALPHPGSYADESAEADYQITFDISKKGADGYLYIYFDGAPAGTMHYKIFTEGTKENS